MNKDKIVYTKLEDGTKIGVSFSQPPEKYLNSDLYRIFDTKYENNDGGLITGFALIRLIGLQEYNRIVETLLK